MTIGHLVPMNNGKQGDEFRKWLQLIIQPVGMSRISCTFHVNKNKRPNSNDPDYILYESIQRKGDKEKFGKPFRTRSIGSGYKKTSERGNEFISCSIETPLVYGGKIHFNLFEAKANENENEEDIFWLYDAVWNPYKKQNNGYQNNNNYAAPTTYTANPSGGGDIPVHIQNAQGKAITSDELANYM